VERQCDVPSDQVGLPTDGGLPGPVTLAAVARRVVCRASVGRSGAGVGGVGLYRREERAGERACELVVVLTVRPGDDDGQLTVCLVQFTLVRTAEGGGCLLDGLEVAGPREGVQNVDLVAVLGDHASGDLHSLDLGESGQTYRLRCYQNDVWHTCFSILSVGT
jgi:hypothetical protein